MEFEEIITYDHDICLLVSFAGGGFHQVFTNVNRAIGYSILYQKMRNHKFQNNC